MVYMKRGQVCEVDGCDSPVQARGLCNAHYKRQRRNGDLKRRKAFSTDHNSWVHPKTGRRYIKHKGKYRFEHIVIAERMYGGPLPKGAQVHHKDGDPSNNDPSNLVICPNQTYHAWLHRKARAQNACGHPDWRQCQICKSWDDPKNLYIHEKSKTIFHRACRRKRYHANKAS